MRILKNRYIIQTLFFLFLVYGFYVGLRLPTFLPMWPCTNSSHYSSGCYLFPLQNFQFGSRVYPEHFRTMPFPGYVVMWGVVKAYLLFFLSLIIFNLLCNKLWCGWMCPFGIFQDGLSFIGKKIRIKSMPLSEKVRNNLKFLKFIMLILFLYIPITYIFNLPLDTPTFCKMCPARSFLSPFLGNFLNFGVGYPPGLLFSIFTIIASGFLLVAMLFIKRFFCYLCPISALFTLFNRLSLLRLNKNVETCNFCGKCWKICPMDIKKVFLDKKGGDCIHDDCIFCLKCVEVCPQKKTLSIKFLKGFLRLRK